jgi:hypothetical protein
MGKIKFVHFWPNFDYKNNFFIDYFESLQEISNMEIKVVSVFQPRVSRLLKKFKKSVRKIESSKLKSNIKAATFELNKSSEVKIWYTAENIRPPLMQNFDYFFSFDQDDFGGRNFYLPLFYIHALEGISQSEDRVGKSVSPDLLLRKRELLAKKSRFACAFINNPDPIRLAAIAELQKYGKVDIFGKIADNYIEKKASVVKDYKYILCFENDLYPGYITEKLYDAYILDTVPLYWGDLGNEKHINRNSFINLKDFTSLADWAIHISNLSELEYENIFQEPLLDSVPQLKKFWEK